MAQTIYVLNGPNLNLLGMREPDIYGRDTLADAEKLCRQTADGFGLALKFHQSNHEGEIIDWIQEAGREKALGILINPAGFTTTSVAIRDAILAVKLPTIELHVSNIFAREAFRHHSMIAPVAKASLCGFGIHSYALAISGLAALAGVQKA